jgi:hypothetical protein
MLANEDLVKFMLAKLANENMDSTSRKKISVQTRSWTSSSSRELLNKRSLGNGVGHVR